MQPFNNEIEKVVVLARFKNTPGSVSFTLNATPFDLNPKPEWSVFLNETMAIDLDTSFTLAAPLPLLNDMEELVFIVKYKFA
ncbi:hypothetical protein [Chitinophaga tropicalis]|uniref:Uncharacterized protein n=1 Tax=Chitinophaga tropicalis TaxID=2683588 RepID=A0A7K1U7R1_9BACT|nr:hypothetical protein [Chitinophaga tropicalis]MVT10393.1 hypothetical protein [Chitinophaga tropicalis]